EWMLHRARTVATSGEGAQSLLNSLNPIIWDRELVALTVTALPLGFVALGLSLNASIPRIMIDRILGTRELGYLAPLASVVGTGRMVAISLGNTAVPRLAEAHARRDKHAFLRTLKQALLFGFALGVLGVAVSAVFGAPLLRLAYGPE